MSFIPATVSITPDDTSKIVITSDIPQTLEILSEAFKQTRHVIFHKDDFLIADSKEAIAEAYITSESTKYLILAAKTFNTYSQNSLLKVLEEPPRNVRFILMAESKTAFLPTIRSRLPIINMKEPKERQSFPFSVKNMDLQDMFGFIKENQFMKKDEAIMLVEALLLQCTHENVKLKEKELELFSKSIRLLQLNERPGNIFTTLLLTLYNRTIR